MGGDENKMLPKKGEKIKMKLLYYKIMIVDGLRASVLVEMNSDTTKLSTLSSSKHQ